MKNTLIADNRRIAYQLTGPSESLPLVLLHGFCEDTSVWGDFVPYLDGLRVVRIDLPGFGKSDLPPAPGMDIYADAVLAVLDEISLKKCVLVGHSMGGYTALAFAEKYSERLAGLGLFHSHPFEDTDESRANRRRGIEMLQSGKRDLYVAQLFPGLFPPAFVKAHPEIINALIDNGKHQFSEGIVTALEGMMARKNHENTLRSSTCPVQFLIGSEDTIAPPDRVLQSAVLPTIADVHVLPDVGHMGMLEAAEKTAGIVRRFWEFCAQR